MVARLCSAEWATATSAQKRKWTASERTHVARSNGKRRPSQRMSGVSSAHKYQFESCHASIVPKL